MAGEQQAAYVSMSSGPVATKWRLAPTHNLTFPALLPHSLLAHHKDRLALVREENSHRVDDRSKRRRKKKNVSFKRQISNSSSLPSAVPV